VRGLASWSFVVALAGGLAGSGPRGEPAVALAKEGRALPGPDAASIAWTITATPDLRHGLLAQQTTGSKTIWDGVYSIDQAQRGRQHYLESCASCHREDLNGDGVTPGLAGEEFIEHWDKATVEDLFRRIKTTMPADRPGSLADADCLDIVAFLLKENGFPGGPSELIRQRDDSLKSILIVRDKEKK
jgi:mono/diheme cytochrome c family protein